jgi:hypothetical protein
MTGQVPATRVVPILWFVAAGLSLLTLGIRVATDRELSWPVAASAVFCLVIGIATWSRARPAPPT